MENKEFTTVQIYREDLEIITSLCKKNENLRDKIHELIKSNEVQKDGKNNAMANLENQEQDSRSNKTIQNNIKLKKELNPGSSILPGDTLNS